MVIARRDPKVAIAADYLAKPRKTRRPQHRFNLKLVPYEIQPFMLAPVLPGETLTDMMLQCQTWSNPLRSEMKNIGWWLQYNFFYVRHRDLPSTVRDLLSAMFLEPTTDMSALQAPADDPSLYTFADGMDYAKHCLQHVVSEYFRDDGEDWNQAVGPTGLPLVQIYGRGSSDGIERLTLDPDYEDRRVNLIDDDGALYANDFSTMMGHWQAMREAGLTDMDYSDFMKTYGSSVREDEESPNLHRAEDLWSFREFTYPTNTVEPTTGVPAVAAGWRTAKKGGKRTYCDEPGFIFGVTYARPKVYLRGQKGSLAGIMGSVRQWLPAVLNNQADLGHVQIDGTSGPFPDLFTATEGFHDYWLDVRDLLIHGDQFLNYDPLETDVPFVNLPKADATRRYVATSEVRKFFAESFKTNGVFEMDGLCSLSVLGRQEKSQPGLVLGRS